MCATCKQAPLSPSTRTTTTQGKDHRALQAHGGVAGLAKALHTDLDRGLVLPAAPASHDELLDVAWDVGDVPLAARQAAFGANSLPVVPPKTLFELWAGNLLDPIILLLIVAATVHLMLMCTWGLLVYI